MNAELLIQLTHFYHVAHGLTTGIPTFELVDRGDGLIVPFGIVENCGQSFETSEEELNMLGSPQTIFEQVHKSAVDRGFLTGYPTFHTRIDGKKKIHTIIGFPDNSKKVAVEKIVTEQRLSLNSSLGDVGRLLKEVNSIILNSHKGNQNAPVAIPLFNGTHDFSSGESNYVILRCSQRGEQPANRLDCLGILFQVLGTNYVINKYAADVTRVAGRLNVGINPKEKEYFKSNPINSIKGAYAAAGAYNKAAREYPGEISNDKKGDAMRHCYWSGTMTRSIGANDAKIIGDNHEYGTGNPNEYDLHNNAVGREIGALSGSDSEVWSRCQRAADEGRLRIRN